MLNTPSTQVSQLLVRICFFCDINLHTRLLAFMKRQPCDVHKLCVSDSPFLVDLGTVLSFSLLDNFDKPSFSLIHLNIFDNFSYGYYSSFWKNIVHCNKQLGPQRNQYFFGFATGRSFISNVTKLDMFLDAFEFSLILYYTYGKPGRATR